MAGTATAAMGATSLMEVTDIKDSFHQRRGVLQVPPWQLVLLLCVDVLSEQVLVPHILQHALLREGHERRKHRVRHMALDPLSATPTGAIVPDVRLAGYIYV